MKSLCAGILAVKSKISFIMY